MSESDEVKKVNICSFWQFRFSHLSRGIGIGVEDRDRHHTLSISFHPTLWKRSHCNYFYSWLFYYNFELIVCSVVNCIVLHKSKDVHWALSFSSESAWMWKRPDSEVSDPPARGKILKKSSKLGLLNLSLKVHSKCYIAGEKSCKSVSLGRPRLVPQLTTWWASLRGLRTRLG